MQNVTQEQIFNKVLALLLSDSAFHVEAATAAVAEELGIDRDTVVQIYDDLNTREAITCIDTI